MRHKLIPAVAFALGLVVAPSVMGVSSAPVTPGHYTVEPGETYRSIATKLGLNQTALACANATSSSCPSTTGQLATGRIIHLTAPVAPPSTSTSSTIAATTTTSSNSTTTSVAPSTTPPTSVAPTTTMDMPMPTTTSSTPPPTSTTQPPADGSFLEDFSVNGTEQLNMGLYRRDNVLIAQTQWQGDHNMSCGAPTTTRTILRTDGIAGDVYRCAAPGMDPHLMISEGDTSGYSIVWISPKQVFQNIKSVCIDINLNFGTLGYRQWPSIAVMPVAHTELTANVPAADAGAGVTIYPPATGFAVADIGSPNGATGKLQINGQRLDYPSVDAGSDNATRYPVCFTDNKNGTLTLKVTGPQADTGAVHAISYTRPGSFPSGDVKVVIQAHQYTATKAAGETGIPVTRNTWHADNVKVTV